MPETIQLSKSDAEVAFDLLSLHLRGVGEDPKWAIMGDAKKLADLFQKFHMTVDGKKLVDDIFK